MYSRGQDKLQKRDQTRYESAYASDNQHSMTEPLAGAAFDSSWAHVRILSVACNSHGGDGVGCDWSLVWKWRAVGGGR